MELWSTILKWFLVILAGYLGSQLVEHFLDRIWKNYRFDKWLFYQLFVRPPYASTKLFLNSKKRPEINYLRTAIVKKFEKEGMDKNEIRAGVYVFKIKNHPTPMQLSIVEPTESGLFTINLETIGQDKLPKLTGNGSFNNTIQIFEKISKLFKEFDLQVINIKITMRHLIFNEDSFLSVQKPEWVINSKTIQVSSKEFSGLTSMVKKAIAEWKLYFV